MSDQSSFGKNFTWVDTLYLQF